MYLEDYFGFLIALLLCMAFSAIASGRVKTTFKKYDKVHARSGKTGYDTVRTLMTLNGVQGIGIGPGVEQGDYVLFEACPGGFITLLVLVEQ
jgi:Zn-dependent membrane protease YugP